MKIFVKLMNSVKTMVSECNVLMNSYHFKIKFCVIKGTIFGKCENIKTISNDEDKIDFLNEISKRYEYEDNIIDNDLPILLHKYEIPDDELMNEESDNDDTSSSLELVADKKDCKKFSASFTLT